MKKVLSIIMAALLTVTLFACGGKGSEPAAPAEATEAAAEVTEAASETTAAPETTTAALETTKAPETTAAPETTTAPETTAEAEVQIEIPKVFHPLVTNIAETGQEPDTNYFIYEVSCPEVHSCESEGDMYPELNGALFQDYKKFQEYVNEVRDRLASNEVAEDSYKHMQGAEIMRADSKVLSVKYGFSGWYGGPHDDYSVFGRNYDTKTGKLLAASDIFTDNEKLKTVLKELLEAEYPDVDFFSLDETIGGYDFDATPDRGETAQYSFCLTGDGAVFWFSPYELASFADGMQVVMLSFSDYPELFKKEYTVAAESFATYLDDDAFYTCGAKTISAGVRFNEYGMIGKLSLSVDGNEEQFDTFSNKASFMLLNSKGKYYVYIFQDSEDDEQFIDIFDVNGEKAVYSGRFEGSMFKEYDRDDAYDAPEGVNASVARITLYSITDPEDFYLKSKDGSIAEYHVGGDGMPEKN